MELGPNKKALESVGRMRATKSPRYLTKLNPRPVAFLIINAKGLNLAGQNMGRVRVH